MLSEISRQTIVAFEIVKQNTLLNPKLLEAGFSTIKAMEIKSNLLGRVD